MPNVPPDPVMPHLPRREHGTPIDPPPPLPRRPPGDMPRRTVALEGEAAIFRDGKPVASGPVTGEAPITAGCPGSPLDGPELEGLHQPAGAIAAKGGA